MESMIPGHKRIKLEISERKRPRKCPSIWKLRNTLQKHPSQGRNVRAN